MGAACVKCPAKIASNPKSEPRVASFARNKRLPMKACPSILNSSKTARSAEQRRSCKRSKAEPFPPQRPAKAWLQAPSAMRRRRAVLDLQGRSTCRRGQHASEQHALLLPLHVHDLGQPPGGPLTTRTHQRPNGRRLTRPGTSRQDQAQGLRVTPPHNAVRFWAKPLIAQPCFFIGEVVREASPRILLLLLVLVVWLSLLSLLLLLQPCCNLVVTLLQPCCNLVVTLL